MKRKMIEDLLIANYRYVYNQFDPSEFVDMILDENKEESERDKKLEIFFKDGASAYIDYEVQVLRDKVEPMSDLDLKKYIEHEFESTTAFLESMESIIFQVD